MKEMARTSVVPLEIPTEIDAASPQSGIRALMVAVLEDAIHNLGSATAFVRDEAEAWIMSRERRYVFSFVVICESLDLEPSAVRRSLIQPLDEEQPGRRLVLRIRPNVRHTALQHSPRVN
jgi:hypothetical protein